MFKWFVHKMIIELTSETSSQTIEIGRQLGQLLLKQLQQSAFADDGAFVIALSGELGAGKTTLTQGIAAGMGVQGPVTSPTFTLVNEYPLAQGVLIHMDSYRLGESNDGAALEAAAFGIDELLDTDHAVLIIEWAERLRDLLPVDTLLITLCYAAADAAGRTLHLQADGPYSQQLLRWLDTQPGQTP
ncbi:MAG: tRNA (adenosine(37)-N6)-threonylcarbamoyltransferase complex ATPase subunit type 1 TsaE [Caldilineaceae bacterium]